MSISNEADWRRLEAAAMAARGRAYAPYSRFAVGAALMTASGEIFAGCNVENASYGLALCAERTAIASAVAAGHREFQKIVVAATPLASPCGACRQWLAEFSPGMAVVSIDPASGHRHLWTVGELLPASFRLEPDRSSPG